MNYTYDPTKIRHYGKDRMRFELGDTIVSGGEEVCALSDEEYLAFLEKEVYGKKEWLQVKLSLLEAILHKLSFQVDTKIDVLSYDFSSRVENFQILYDKLKKEIDLLGAPVLMNGTGKKSTDYFHSGMQSNSFTVPPFTRKKR